MSDVSFPRSGAKNGASPFDRLKVKASGVSSGGESSPKAKIFKEVGNAADPRLSGLDQAVANVESTKKSLAAIGESGGVEKTNLDASQASVRDVEEAAKLAGRIADGIGQNPKLFEAAQVNKIDVPAAQALTRADDGTIA